MKMLDLRVGSSLFRQAASLRDLQKFREGCGGICNDQSFAGATGRLALAGLGFGLLRHFATISYRFSVDTPKVARPGFEPGRPDGKSAARVQGECVCGFTTGPLSTQQGVTAGRPFRSLARRHSILAALHGRLSLTRYRSFLPLQFRQLPKADLCGVNRLKHLAKLITSGGLLLPPKLHRRREVAGFGDGVLERWGLHRRNSLTK